MLHDDLCVCVCCSVAGLRSDGAGTGNSDAGQRRRLDLRTGVRQRYHQPAGHRQNEPSDTSRRRHIQRCVRTTTTTTLSAVSRPVHLAALAAHARLPSVEFRS